MANYPTSLDAFTNPTSVDSLSSPSHSDQHANANDAIEALEAKVGIGTSTAGSATAGHVLVASSGGTTSWTTVSAGAISTTGGTAGQYLSAGTAGVAEWADVTAAGLTLIETKSFTTQTAIQFDNCFTSTYSNYMAITKFSAASSNCTILFRLVDGTSPVTTTDYVYSQWINYMPTGSTTSDWSGSAAFGVLGNLRTATPQIFANTLQITSPQLAQRTNWSYAGSGQNAVNPYSTFGSGYFVLTTQFEGIQFYPDTGNLTGEISIYGYKK